MKAGAHARGDAGPGLPCRIRSSTVDDVNGVDGVDIVERGVLVLRPCSPFCPLLGPCAGRGSLPHECGPQRLAACAAGSAGVSESWNPVSARALDTAAHAAYNQRAFRRGYPLAHAVGEHTPTSSAKQKLPPASARPPVPALPPPRGAPLLPLGRMSLSRPHPSARQHGRHDDESLTHPLGRRGKDKRLPLKQGTHVPANPVLKPLQDPNKNGCTTRGGPI